MRVEVCAPTAALVAEAGRKFDEENYVAEQALQELFGLFPNNRNESHVLLKVVVLNRLYWTQIFAVHAVANHIWRNADQIDAGLATGSPDVVDLIARVKIAEKEHHFYSFASKYCHWHRPDLYAIYDSKVDKYLWSLQRQAGGFANIFKSNADLWDYTTFRRIVEAFREHYGLIPTFKEIDKFLWHQGEESVPVNDDQSSIGLH